MEPLSAATSFATIVSLVGQFRAERSAKEQANFNEFMQWLQETQHKELKDLLEINTKATISIKAILNQDRNLILERINNLDKALTAYASGLEGFSTLGDALHPDAILSEQALDILRQFEVSGASKILQLNASNEIVFLFMDGSGQLEISEPRFIEDDLSTLVELGLIRHDYNSKGENIYLYTRAGSRLVGNSKKDS